MPVRRQLHPPHSLALHRVGDDRCRCSDRAPAEISEGIENCIEIVTIDSACRPSERGESILDRLDRHHIIGEPIDAQLVAVDDHHQVAELEVPCRHRRLPDLSLAQLAVAEHAPGAMIRSSKPTRERHADGDR